MRQSIVVSRQGLLQLLTLIPSNVLAITGEELGHPNPREIIYEFTGKGGKTYKEKFLGNSCVRLVSVQETVSVPEAGWSSSDRYGANSFLVVVEIADYVIVRRGGLVGRRGPTTARYSVPNRLVEVIKSIR